MRASDCQSRQQNPRHGHWLFRETISYSAMAAIVLISVAELSKAAAPATLAHAIRQTQPKMVKIFGAGGIARLEGYQSGFLVTGRGHVLTVWSYVLDEGVTVVLADGSRFDAQLVSADPRTEIALLQLDYEGEDLPHFRLDDSAKLKLGSRVLAFSNLFRIAAGDEPVSVQHGVISSIAPGSSRAGTTHVRFQGERYILDAITSNPGAAGGALTDHQGRLVAMIGKEHRDQETNLWSNDALPVDAFADRVRDMLEGRFLIPDPSVDVPKPERPLTTTALGLVLVPDVVAHTPPYVDAVWPNSVAARAGIRPDDLVVYVEDHLITSCRALQETLARYECDMPVRIVVLRGHELIEKTLSSTSARLE